MKSKVILQKFLSMSGTSTVIRRAWFLLHHNIGLLKGVQGNGERAQLEGDVEVLAMGGHMPAKTQALGDQARFLLVQHKLDIRTAKPDSHFSILLALTTLGKSRLY